MKKYVFIIGLSVLAVLPATLAAQTDTVFQRREVIIIDEDPASTTTQTREVIVRDTRKHRVTHRKDELKFFNTINLGYNGLVQDLGSLKLPEEASWMELQPKSINFNLMLMSYEYNFNRHFGFRTGLELEVNNYRFEQDVTLKLGENGHVAPDWRFAEAGLSLKKTKLVNSFLNVPLVLRVGIGRRNQLEVYGGMVGGWRWNSYTKLKAKNELLNGKDRIRQNYNLRNFHYGYTAGITFHNIGFYATYYPHSIFKSDDIDVRQVNVGLTFKY